MEILVDAVYFDNVRFIPYKSNIVLTGNSNGLLNIDNQTDSFVTVVDFNNMYNGMRNV